MDSSTENVKLDHPGLEPDQGPGDLSPEFLGLGREGRSHQGRGLVEEVQQGHQFPQAPTPGFAGDRLEEPDLPEGEAVKIGEQPAEKPLKVGLRQGLGGGVVGEGQGLDRKFEVGQGGVGGVVPASPRRGLEPVVGQGGVHGASICPVPILANC